LLPVSGVTTTDHGVLAPHQVGSASPEPVTVVVVLPEVCVCSRRTATLILPASEQLAVPVMVAVPAEAGRDHQVAATRR
jgi:hypothetical protein